MDKKLTTNIIRALDQNITHFKASSLNVQESPNTTDVQGFPPAQNVLNKISLIAGEGETVFHPLDTKRLVVSWYIKTDAQRDQQQISMVV